MRLAKGEILKMLTTPLSPKLWLVLLVVVGVPLNIAVLFQSLEDEIDMFIAAECLFNVFVWKILQYSMRPGCHSCSASICYSTRFVTVINCCLLSKIPLERRN